MLRCAKSSTTFNLSKVSDRLALRWCSIKTAHLRDCLQFCRGGHWTWRLGREQKTACPALLDEGERHILSHNEILHLQMT